MLKESRWIEKSILDNLEELQQSWSLTNFDQPKEKDPTKETEMDLPETLQKNQECAVPHKSRELCF